MSSPRGLDGFSGSHCQSTVCKCAFKSILDPIRVLCASAFRFFSIEKGAELRPVCQPGRGEMSARRTYSSHSISSGISSPHAPTCHVSGVGGGG
jgi:hypothetical protein